jgi:hypothetical protein
MSTRNKTLLGLITAGLLTAGVAWAADVPGTTISDRTVVPVEGSGTVTLELVTEGLAIVEAIPDEGWTVTVERSIGSEVEAHFDSAGSRVDFNAELKAEGEIEVEIERFVGGSSTSSTTLITSTSVTAPSTSSTIDAPVSTTIDDDGVSTSTTGGESSTSTTVDDNDASTSTTVDDNDASTSTTVDDNDAPTSTTIDDDIVDLPDGPRIFTVGAAGTVVVNVEAGRLALATVTTGLGWSYEVETAESDDIRVEFESHLDAEAEIRVRINDGRLEVRIENN